MEFTIRTADIVAILSALFGTGGVGVLLLKFKGLITFGKPVERRNFNSYNNLHQDILTLSNDMKKLRQCVNNINLQLEKHISYQKGKESH